MIITKVTYELYENDSNFERLAFYQEMPTEQNIQATIDIHNTIRGLTGKPEVKAVAVIYTKCYEIK